MSIGCPHCQSTNVNKNGFTHYGKQNHQCRHCRKQFVRHNTHYITKEKKRIIKGLLKERIALRAIARSCQVSLSWLQAYAKSLWRVTPRHLGTNAEMVQKIKKSQVFGLQMDELWGFAGKKSRKRWLWICYDPVHRWVAAFHIGGRGEPDAKRFWGKIPHALRSCPFETDQWEAYKRIIPEAQHKVGKDLTYYIEGFNTTLRARVSRLVRRSLSFSKRDEWHNRAIAWFFWQFNLERKPYI